MKPTLVLPLLLTGCVSDVSEYQLLLDKYAHMASDGQLSTILTGSALHEAVQSQELLAELGWIQRGKSMFTQTQISGPNQVLSCLDVSGVRFFDALGAAVNINRPSQRLLMQIDFSHGTPRLISQLQEVGKC